MANRRADKYNRGPTMTDDWRLPEHERHFRTGCIRVPCMREPCFREPCEPGGKGGGDDPEFFFVEFNGTSSRIDCGSDASTDNLAAAAFTVDGWVYRPTSAAAADLICGKCSDEFTFWGIYLDYDFPDTAPGIMVYKTDTTGFAQASLEWKDGTGLSRFDTWMHIAVVFDSGIGTKIWVAVNGEWTTYNLQQAQAALPMDDSDWDLTIGGTADLNRWLLGNIQWIRISSGLRYTHGVAFTPPDMCAPPAVDANTVELWALDEGTGALTAASIVVANQGTMTDCVWHECVP